MVSNCPIATLPSLHHCCTTFHCLSLIYWPATASPLTWNKSATFLILSSYWFIQTKPLPVGSLDSAWCRNATSTFLLLNCYSLYGAPHFLHTLIQPFLLRYLNDPAIWCKAAAKLQTSLIFDNVITLSHCLLAKALSSIRHWSAKFQRYTVTYIPKTSISIECIWNVNIGLAISWNPSLEFVK